VSNDVSVSSFFIWLHLIVLTFIMLINSCFAFTGITNNGYIERNTRSRGVHYNRVLLY
jgi:hypothetical protein